MPSTKKNEPVDPSWQQLEDFADRLHQLAAAPLSPAEFYRRLLDDCVAALSAVGGAVWLPAVGAGWKLASHVNLRQVRGEVDPDHLTLGSAALQAAVASPEPRIFQPHSGGNSCWENPTDSLLLLAAVYPEDAPAAEQPAAVIQLYLRAGSGPAVEEGWRELLSTVCQIAGGFHTREQLRTLQSERGLHDQSLALLRRIHSSVELNKTVHEIANEGQRFLGADRVSVLLRRGRRWRLRAVSGVDHFEKRGDTAKRLRVLAGKVAAWGEPVDYGNASAGDEPWQQDQELPPALAEAVEQHVDQSHARRLVAVPIVYVDDRSGRSRWRWSSRQRPSAVLIAEQFRATGDKFSCQRVAELAELCEPALRQAVRLDRFPLRTLVRWSDRLSVVRVVWSLFKLGLAVLAAVAVVAALVYVPRDFEVEAPATLTPLVVRDVFATADGTVSDLRIAHGEQVVAGQVLAVLQSPELELELQRVQGEIDTARKRLEAIAVARTERLVREDVAEQSMPLSAESQQVEQRLVSLGRQREILTLRRDTLTVRSPIAGTVLTLDLQNLLRARPVERGQVLFTVADPTAGWRLLAEVSQDLIGHVVAASQKVPSPLAVRFRLAGDVSQVYRGHVESISTQTVLDTDDLYEDSPPLQVRVAVDKQSLPAARPGMTAQVRIYCGQRPLGYVWLHDVWEQVYSWWVF